MTPSQVVSIGLYYLNLISIIRDFRLCLVEFPGANFNFQDLNKFQTLTELNDPYLSMTSNTYTMVMSDANLIRSDKDMI